MAVICNDLLKELAANFMKETGSEVPDVFRPNPIMDEPDSYMAEENQRNFSKVPKDTKVVIIEYFSNETTWEHLKTLVNSPARETIDTLYLQHDGVIFGKKEDIRDTINGLPNLKKIYYCGYYTKYDDDLIECVDGKNIELEEIF